MPRRPRLPRRPAARGRSAANPRRARRRPRRGRGWPAPPSSAGTTLRRIRRADPGRRGRAQRRSAVRLSGTRRRPLQPDDSRPGSADRHDRRRRGRPPRPRPGDRRPRPGQGPPDPGLAWAAPSRPGATPCRGCSGHSRRRDARHSYAVLRGLTSSGGGMVAAATMSLPERAAQGRNYDYRYVWIRDQCYAGQAVAADGPHPLLDDAVALRRRALLADGPDLKPAYTITGEPVPDERQLDLPGYPGGRDIVRQPRQRPVPARRVRGGVAAVRRRRPPRPPRLRAPQGARRRRRRDRSSAGANPTPGSGSSTTAGGPIPD